MYKNSFLKIELVSPNLTIGNPLANADEIISWLDNSKSAICLFPELSISGYSIADLFYNGEILDKSLSALKKVIQTTKYKGVYVLGFPLELEEELYNTAVVVQNKKILGIVPKYNIPNTKEFYEKRWFKGYTDGFKIKTIDFLDQTVVFGPQIFTNKEFNINFAIEICQDAWEANPISNYYMFNGSHLILNLSASTEVVGKRELRRQMINELSRKQYGAYLYVSSGSTEAITDSVYSDHKLGSCLGGLVAESKVNDSNKNLIIDLNTDSIKFARRSDDGYKNQKDKFKKTIHKSSFEIFSNDDYLIETVFDKFPFYPNKSEEEILIASSIQVKSLINKLEFLPTAKVVIGISGGLDSTLALLTAVIAFKELNKDLKDIIAVTMSAEATSKRSKNDALGLMTNLGVTLLDYPINESVELHLGLIEHDKKDVTYENTQARIRTLILMNLANKYNGFVLGTGDLSEIALGFMTYNGDHMSMYNPNCGLTKTWIRLLTEYYSNNEFKHVKKYLDSILNAPISPELITDQKTEDIIGRYDINDFILYYLLVKGNAEKTIKWLVSNVFDISLVQANEYVDRFVKRFYSQQFKRQPSPEGPKVLQTSLSPRTELRIPSDLKRK